MINFNVPFLQNFFKVAIRNDIPDIEKTVWNKKFRKSANNQLF